MPNPIMFESINKYIQKLVNIDVIHLKIGILNNYFCFLLKYLLTSISGTKNKQTVHAQSIKFIFMSCQTATKVKITQTFQILVDEPPKGMKIYLINH